MKFIHCADIHLDSKMETNLSKEKARNRRRELLQTVQNMVAYGQEQKVSAILIAGDLFDSSWISENTIKQVETIIRTNSNIDFLYLRGNHDTEQWIQRLGDIPSNLKLFSNQWTTYSYGMVDITGVEFSQNETLQNEQDLYEKLQLREEKTNIVMLHGQIQQGNSMQRERISLLHLTGKHIDYLALGHIHKYQTGRLDHRGVWCYSGCLEGRGFDECGNKGFVELTIDESGKITSRFVEQSKRTLHEIVIDLTDCQNIGSVEEVIQQALKNVPSADLVRLVLTGTVTPKLDPPEQMIQQNWESRFYYLEVQKKTQAIWNREPLYSTYSLKGTFIRLVQNSDLSEEEKSQVIRCGIKALEGEDIL